ncbi:MAG: hypothetical protein HY906_16925 [Deltaproteobacteria bacterium]|nr:hypothetical protein [Deltaproteobacteria bacterium]
MDPSPPTTPTPAAEEPLPKRAARRLYVGLAAIGGVALLLILGMLFAPEHARLLPVICYRIEPRSIGAGVVLALTFLGFPFAVRLVLSDAAAWRKLVAAVALGFGLQWSFALAEQKGTRPLLERLWETGHAEFLRLSMTPLPPDYVRRYDDYGIRQKWLYARTKPPGALVVYRAVAVVAKGPVGGSAERLFYGEAPRDFLTHARMRLSGVLFVLFPLLTFLALVPLVYLARPLAGERGAWLAVLLYPVTPSALLVTMHLDGAIYPLFGCAALALALAARRRAWLAAAGGAVLSRGVLITVGRRALVPLAGALAVLGPGEGAERPARARLLRALGQGALFAAGFLAVHLFFMVALGYRPFARYADARLVHHVWKTTISLQPWLTLNPIQFVLWVGIPVMGAFLADTVLGLTRGGWRTVRGLFGPLLVVVILVTNQLGEAKSEVMRLWLFFVPLVCVAAAARLVAWEEHARRWLVPVTLALQLLYVFALKSNFDCH